MSDILTAQPCVGHSHELRVPLSLARAIVRKGGGKISGGPTGRELRRQQARAERRANRKGGPLASL